MLKELTTDQTLNSLFLELMKKRYTDGMRLLSKLLESETTPFMKQYIKHCKSFTLNTFLTIRYQSITDPSLDVSQLLSPYCVAASNVNFSEFEDRFIDFFEDKTIRVISSNNFKPSQWSFSAFNLLVREADFLQLKIDWSSWCGDANLVGEHFNPEFWNTEDGNLWRLLNYKCVKRMTESRRILIRSKFPAIFKLNTFDSSKLALMKIITLAATYLVFKELRVDFPKEAATIKQNINSLLKHIINNHKMGEDSLSLLRTAAKIIKNCGIQLEASNFAAQSPKRVLSLVYHLLKGLDGIVNSSWLLNLIYLSVKNPNYISIDTSINKIIDWFFELNPSVQNICQLLEIFEEAGSYSRLQTSILSKLGLDTDLLSQVHKQCPKHSNSLIVPFESRISTILKRKRVLFSRIMRLNIPATGKDNFWALLRIIIREPTIFNHNNVIFENGFSSAHFFSLDRFFEHFLDIFLNNPALYLLTGTEKKNGKPIIVPSLKTPERVIRVLFAVLARSVILNFKVPFYIHYELFSARFSTSKNKNGHFSSILKMKRIFVSDRNLIDSSDVIACDRINKEGGNVDLVSEHLVNVCTRTASHARVSDSTFIRLMEAQFQAVHRGIYKIFPQDVVFKPEELYSLMFMR